MARNIFKTTENATPIYSFQMTDSADGTTIPLSSLTTLTLTYYNVVDGVIINSRDDQDILNVNDVAVSSTGLVTWRIVTGDTAISDTTITEAGEFESHRALFQWTYSSSDSTTKSGNDEIDIKVRNQTKIT